MRVAVYAQELARKAGRTSSRRRLSKQIPIDEWLEYDPVRIGLFDGLFSTTCFDVTAWVILHEVGHHALGHMTSPSSPNSQRREELDADRWALDAMRRAGMTTFYVGSYLAARDTFERAEHEVVGEPEGSLYPTWGERLAAYEKRISADGELEGLLGRNGMTMTLFPFAPTEDSTRFGLVIIPFGMKEGEIKIVALGTILASVFQFEHQSFLPAIRRDGAIRVFERSGPESTIVELAFADDGYTLTDMTVRVRPSPDAMVQENEGSAWQTNGSSVLYGVHMDGNPAWALGHEVKLEHAMMSGLSPRDAEEFIASMEEIQQLRLRPLLDFHEGKLSLEELRTEAKRTKEVAIERQAAVRAKVGDHVWMRFFELQSPKGELGKCIVDRDFAECSEEFDEAFEKSIGVRD